MGSQAAAAAKRPTVGNPTKAGGKRGKKKLSMAERADRHRLYEESVQCVEAEIDFVDRTFRKLRGRKPASLREDFGGTANTSSEFVRRRRSNTAIAVDLDREVQQWGLEHNVGALKPSARDRIRLLNANVLEVDCAKVDVILAMNFSYWIFETRDLLRTYFRRVRAGLVDDGMFMLDAYGGPDSMREMKERTPFGNFTYIWDQHSYDPITGHCECRIHFSFPDGSRLKNAFTYQWRLWTLPEIREILLDAGFARVTIYWEGTDEETREGNGEYSPAAHGEADDAFIVYIVAEK
jgi:cyclopropane fatty-acyl-phospholipid synthase-like methyltransferase